MNYPILQAYVGQKKPERQIIVVMSGRKGSGKNTLAKFIARYFVDSHPIDKRFSFDKISDFQLEALRQQLVKERCLECSFADALKEFCIDVLGLTREQCYGSDEEKCSPTKYQWENAPDFLRWKFGYDEIAKRLIAEGIKPNDILRVFAEKKWGRKNSNWCMRDGTFISSADADVSLLKSGPMTGRDIMQIMGTDLIRHTFGNVWAEATVRKIKKEGKPFSIITDNRFPNEIECVLREPYSYIIRLTRSPFGTEDVHPSESALDFYNWERERCYVLDNSKMTIEEQNEAVKPILQEILNGSKME